MFDLEKREKFILLLLLAILIVGIILGLYQKRAVYIDVKPDSFTYPANEPPAGTLKIDINKSDAAGLMKLKGVGKVLADRIIGYRTTNGNFISVEDLKKVKGLGQKLYEKIKDEVIIE